MRQIFFYIYAILILLLLSACANLRPPEFHGATYTNPAPPPNFSFPSTLGRTFTLHNQRGKVVLLFFGYTYCPDVCPATLGTIKTSLNQLTPEERNGVSIVFVTMDPERDSVDVLGKYLDSFKSGFIGAVPTLNELEQLKTDYGIVADKEEVQDDGSYLMAHTGLVYVIDKEGNLRLGFFSKTTADEMTNDIKILLNQ